MEDKTPEEIKTEVQSTTLLKNSVISVGKHWALITYKPAQPGIKFARNNAEEPRLRINLTK